MAKRIAIDWDDIELRLVAAQKTAVGMRITDAAVVPIGEEGFAETLRSAVSSRGLEKAETLVAIGRGKAELREMKLPAVPDNELPDMVRFQALRTFASAGDAATVDFLVTKRGDEGIEMIAAAIGSGTLESVRESVEKAGLQLKRVALRPLTAAALYLSRNAGETGESVLIDLLASDAEIVIARDGKVIFVRTVRLPNEPAARPTALAGELRRSLLACGSGSDSRRVYLWGRESVHQNDVEMLGQAIGGSVTMLDPFGLVDIGGKAADKLPDHVGRLAPLVGLLACDDTDSDRLIDFLNPRKRIEKVVDHRKTAALVGVPVLLAGLVGWTIYSQLAGRTRQIESLQAEIEAMEPAVESALVSVDRTARLDQFLDGDVNWLSELTRVAESIPPADALILTSVNANATGRSLGSRPGMSNSPTIKLEGLVTDASVIDPLQDSLRDEHHRVIGEGTKREDSEDAYRWTFAETVFIDPEIVRQKRYEGIAAAAERESTQAQSGEDPGTDEAADADRASEPETGGDGGSADAAAEVTR